MAGIFRLGLWAALCLVFATASWAETRGDVTNLPLPRFVSLKAGEGNVRRGPSLSHRIDWVFKRRDMPLVVTAYAEAGVVARLGDCTLDWCRLNADGRRGWVTKAALWGVAPAEIRE